MNRLRNEFINVFCERWKRVALTICILFLALLKQYDRIHNSFICDDGFNSLEVLKLCMKGVSNYYNPDVEGIPIEWLSFYIACILMVSGIRDKSKSRFYYDVIKEKGRKNWYINKVIDVLILTFFVFLLFVLGGSIPFLLSAKMLSIEELKRYLLYILAMYFSIVFITLIHLIVELYCNQAIAIMLDVMLVFLSMFLPGLWIPLQQTMAFRNGSMSSLFLLWDLLVVGIVVFSETKMILRYEFLK